MLLENGGNSILVIQKHQAREVVSNTYVEKQKLQLRKFPNQSIEDTNLKLCEGKDTFGKRG
jgi:hypothetical protein